MSESKLNSELAILSGEYLVEKSKDIISCITEPLTLGEYRLFDTYLSRINPRNDKESTVVFTKYEFIKLLGGKRINDKDLVRQLKGLLSKQVNLAKYDASEGSKGNVTLFNIFSAASMLNNYGENNEKVILFKCNEDVKPLLFNIAQQGYLKYQLKNILNLKSVNAINLYNYLIANAFRRNWEVDIRSFVNDALFIKGDYYYDYKVLNAKILKGAVGEINEKTNLTVSYAKGRTAGTTNRKVVGVVFEILRYDNNIYLHKNNQMPKTATNQVLDLNLLNDVCKNEFDDNQVQILLDEVISLNEEWIKSETGMDNVFEAYVKFIESKYIVVRRGKKKYYLGEIK